MYILNMARFTTVSMNALEERILPAKGCGTLSSSSVEFEAVSLQIMIKVRVYLLPAGFDRCFNYD